MGSRGVAVCQFLNFGTIDRLLDNSLWRVGLPCACLVVSSISACDPRDASGTNPSSDNQNTSRPNVPWDRCGGLRTTAV